jgi:hypothetical protein
MKWFGINTKPRKVGQVGNKRDFVMGGREALSIVYN